MRVRTRNKKGGFRCRTINYRCRTGDARVGRLYDFCPFLLRVPGYPLNSPRPKAFRWQG